MGGRKPGKRLKRAASNVMCSKPDHDVPGLVCGFPLPCPYHTVVVDATCKPPMLTHAKRLTQRTQRRLFDIGSACQPTFKIEKVEK